MAKENTKMKVCKYCQTEISKKAKICPHCRKKQGGILKWIIIGVLILFLLAGTLEEDSEIPSDSNPKKTNKVETENSKNNETQNEVDNIFNIGDVVETSNLKISYLSAEKYDFDNMFIEPKDGNVFYRMEFEFENIGKSDQLASSWDFECYADGYSMEQTYGDDDLQQTISAGKKAKGAVYFEVPEDAKEILLEYELNFWTEDKVIFVVK